jgi:hypothetical protein
MDKQRLKTINMLRQCRRLTTKAVTGLSEKQLLHIPDGYRNNILWNLGHVAVTQQRLCYKFSGLDLYIPEALCEVLKIGSSPADWKSPPDFNQIMAYIEELPDKLEEDLRSNRFENFHEYTTFNGVTMCDIDDAIIFNNIHEGVHLGIILSLRKAVR